MQLMILFGILVGFTMALYEGIFNLPTFVSVILALATWILIVLIYLKSRLGRKFKQELDEYEKGFEKEKERWIDKKVKKAEKRGFLVKETKKQNITNNSE